MQVKNIKYTSFRNLKLEFPADTGINLIVGKNGSGKSNFIDSLYLLSHGASFKRMENKDNIAWGSRDGFARIAAELVDDEQQVELVYVFTENTNRVYVNGKVKSKRSSQFILKTVLFAPHNLDLVLGSPDIRRDELDTFLSLCDEEYAFKSKRYKEVLRNRNKLLANIEQGLSGKNELVYWTTQLLDLGSYLIDMRVKLIEDLRPIFVETASKWFTKALGKLDLKYESRFVDNQLTVREVFGETLKGNINKEIVVGRTLYGPHRDDLKFIFAEHKNVLSHASRGQQRITALIFKISQLYFLEARYGLKPILLLDDIFSELDEKNSERFVEVIKNADTQTFMTNTDEKSLPKNLKFQKILKLS